MKKKFDKASRSFSQKETREIRAQQKPFSWKRALYLLLSTVASFALLESVILLEASAGFSFSVITLIYYLLATLLFFAVILLNRGFSKQELTPELLDESVAPDEAKRICDKVNRQKRQAKKIMLILVPLVFAILFDMIYLFYGDILARFFSLFA